MPLDFDECCYELQLDGLDITPSDLQGSLCGRLSGGHSFAEQDFPEFVAALTGHSLTSLVLVKDMLNDLYRDTKAQLNAEAGLVELLLPDDEEPLSDRIQALSGWCQSYLSGLGQSGLSGETELAPDVAEAMRDLAAIALLDADGEQDSDDEANFVELVEFVRVASTLIHMEREHLMFASDNTRH